jgi:hypothetical protein
VVSIHATKTVDAAPDFASAERVPLGSKGPFSFYGKCYGTGNGRVEATTYIASTSSTGMFDTEAADSGYVTPSTAEAKTRLQDVAALANSAPATAACSARRSSASARRSYLKTKRRPRTARPPRASTGSSCDGGARRALVPAPARSAPAQRTSACDGTVAGSALATGEGAPPVFGRFAV